MKRDQFNSEVSALAALSERLGSFGKSEAESIAVAAKSLAVIYNASDGSSHQHAQRVAAAAGRFQEHVKRTASQLSEREQGGIAALDEARRERLGMQTDKYVLAVTLAFQNADSKARLAMLGQAVEGKHGPTLAMLAEAPSYVTGVDPAMLAQHLEAAEQKHAPDLAQRREQFNQDRSAMQTVLAQAQALAARAVDLESVELANQADAAEAELARVTTA
jgi:hypothetical protein